jgi:ubiquinone/menaquinone biosynthesis C-methylase UbiE
MPDEMRAQIRDIWDSASEHYDNDPGHGILSEDERRHWLSIIRRLIPGGEPRRVLDVGTGPGVMAFLLAELGHEVTGIDIAPGMLARARAHNEERGAGVRFEGGAADAPPFAEGSFDVVFSRHVVWALPDPAAAVEAWRRVLAPGGQVVVIDGLWPHGLVDRTAMFAGKVIGWLTRQKGDDHTYPEELYEKLPMVHERSLAEIERVFTGAGLRDVHAEFIPRGESHRPTNLRERLMNRWRGYALSGRV